MAGKIRKIERLFQDEETKTILEEILVRLPAKDLARSKLVRKYWRDLIESPDFVSAHLNHPSRHHILFQEDDEDLDNKLKSNWDDEDLDDNDVKDSWEEEDEPAPAPKTEPMPIEKPPKKTVSKTVEKKGNSSEAVKEAPLDAKDVVLSITASANEKINLQKEANAGKKKTEDEPVLNLHSALLPLCLIQDLFFGPNDEKYDIDTTSWEPEPWERRYVKKEQDISSDVESSEAEKKKKKGFEALKEAPLDPSGEELCQQRLVGEADYKSTAELFGKMGDEKTLDNFIPKSESDFTEYAELVAHKLRPYEKSYHYIGLLKAVMRLSMVSLKGSDAKDVVLSITAIANEKIKVENEANAGKKKTEDETVPSLLKKDYKLKSNNSFTKEDDEDLDNKLKSNWDDEDLDDNDVNDSWEEEDEPAPAPKTEPMPIEKPPKETVAKMVEKKGNSSEAVKEAPLDEPVVNLPKEDYSVFLPLCLIKDLFFGPNDEDEPVPSLLKKDNKRKSTWDDGDLDDNENKTKRFEEALKEAPLDPVEDLDDRFIRPCTEAVGNTNSNQNDEQGEELAHLMRILGET
ncbi:hypothetical protein CASFOL_027287 [Castilleja foliolosa]|uniref:Eukaryotic translation initiation factor 3 30 kDa subunit n=1 Tax=Castilleja foliolosa TaxID=1961234 RepID=A0ABD3CGU6_9LAMI